MGDKHNAHKQGSEEPEKETPMRKFLVVRFKGDVWSVYSENLSEIAAKRLADKLNAKFSGLGVVYQAQPQ